MGTIYESIAAIMADVDAIGKNKKNTQQGFMFRGIDDIYNTLHPLLAKHGVFTLPEVLEERTEERKTKSGGTLIYRILKIKYHFCAADGSSVEAVVMGEGMDSGDKAGNKAMSIAHKYAFFQVFAIPTEDLVDPDADTPPPSEPIKKDPKEGWDEALRLLAEVLEQAVKDTVITDEDLSRTLDKVDSFFTTADLDGYRHAVIKHLDKKRAEGGLF